MTLLFDSVVRRHMKDTSGFVLYADGAALPVALTLEGNEKLIGWYRNPAPWHDSVLLFTTNAIWTFDGNAAERLPLREIAGYESPQSKESATGIRIRFRDGFRFLRAAGASGPDNKYKDHLAILNILRAILKSAALPP